MAYPAGVRTMPVLRALALPGLLEYSVSLLAISSAGHPANRSPV